MEIENGPEVVEKSVYTKWVESQGIPVLKGFYIEDIRKAKLEPWERMGGLGAFINLFGDYATNDAYLCEIPAGQTLKPQKHLFEEIVFVVVGAGKTLLRDSGGREHAFEWKCGSLFSPPLNHSYQHVNTSTSEPARYVSVTTAPLTFNLLHDLDFVLNNSYEFKDRFLGPDFYGQKALLRPTKRISEANRPIVEAGLIPDVRNFQLGEWKERGGGSLNMEFELANNTLTAHVSEVPVGTYKKAHRHDPGAHIIHLTGNGYSLLWAEKRQRVKIDWRPYTLYVPPNYWWHQHFNASDSPARYLAIRWNSKKYPIWGEIPLDKDAKTGGDQIEYEDEDPEIKRMFNEAISKQK